MRDRNLCTSPVGSVAQPRLCRRALYSNQARSQIFIGECDMRTTGLSPAMRVRECTAVLLVAALMGGASLAYAQETTGLEEIVVTAQRHAENAQDVPISVSALDGDQLSSMIEGGDDIR